MVELISITAMVALLIVLLMPTLKSARAAANNARCKSQQHQLGFATFSYSTDSKGAVMIAAPRFWIYRLPLPQYSFSGPTCPGYYDIWWDSYLYDLKYFHNTDMVYCPSDELGHNPPLAKWNTGRVIGNWIYNMSNANNASYGLNYFGFGLRYLPTSEIDMTTPVSGRFWKNYQVKRPAKTFFLGDNADSVTDGFMGFGLYPDFYHDDMDITTRHGPTLNLFWMDGHVDQKVYDEYMRHHYYGYYYNGGPLSDPRWFNPDE